MSSFCSDLVLHRRVFQMSLILGLGGTFLFGFQVSMINSTSPYIKTFINNTWLERYSVPIDEQSLTLLWSFIVSTFSIGGLIGTTISRSLTAKYGRKNCLMFCSLLTLVAAVIMGSSKTATSFEMILLGRLLYGFNAGLGCCIQGQYLGEISPKHLRGLTNVTLAIFANLGKFLGQVMGLYELLGTESLWPILLASSGATGLVVLITVPLFPESPRYLLIQKGDLDGCLIAMDKLWGKGNYKAEVDDMLKEQEFMKNTKIMSVLELLKAHSMRRQLCLLTVLASTLTLSGVNAIYFYSFEVFRISGFDLKHIPYITLGVGFCELFSILVCFFSIEHCNRRKLLLWGYGLMMLILALLTITLSLQHHFFWIPYCNIVLIFIFIITFGTGPAGVTFPVMVELFTQASRPAALVLSMSIHWTGLYFIGIFFPYVVHYMGTFSFLVFVGVIAISWVLLFWFLPETKGKSFVDIQGEFNRVKRRKKREAEMEKSLPEVPTMCTKL